MGKHKSSWFGCFLKLLLSAVMTRPKLLPSSGAVGETSVIMCVVGVFVRRDKVESM